MTVEVTVEVTVVVSVESLADVVVDVAVVVEVRVVVFDLAGESPAPLAKKPKLALPITSRTTMTAIGTGLIGGHVLMLPFRARVWNGETAN